MFGRVKMFNLGFAIFAVFSVLLSLTWLHGTAGAWWLIGMRILQAVGGAGFCGGCGPPAPYDGGGATQPAGRRAGLNHITQHQSQEPLLNHRRRPSGRDWPRS
jgi:hypothetical protein